MALVENVLQIDSRILVKFGCRRAVGVCHLTVGIYQIFTTFGYGIFLYRALLLILYVCFALYFFLHRLRHLFNFLVSEDAYQFVCTVAGILRRIGQNSPLHAQHVFVTSFISEALDFAEVQVLPLTRLVFRHHLHTLNGMLSHTVEEVIHNARFSGNIHDNFLGNVFVIIVAAARCEGESSKHRKGESPEFHCFHFDICC